MRVIYIVVTFGDLIWLLLGSILLSYIILSNVVKKLSVLISGKYFTRQSSALGPWSKGLFLLSFATTKRK